MKLILPVLLFSVLLAGCENEPRPSYTSMVEYRLSLYSDDQIRAAYAVAQRDAENSNKKIEEANRKISALVNEANEKGQVEFNARNPPPPAVCSDIAYHVRHEGRCTDRGEYQGTKVASLEKVEPFHLLTSRLYGECLKAKTVTQAISMNCLPAGYKAPPQRSASR